MEALKLKACWAIIEVVLGEALDSENPDDVDAWEAVEYIGDFIEEQAEAYKQRMS